MEICQRCSNIDPYYFYKGHKGVYCRKCISFKRQLLLEDIQVEEDEITISDGSYKLNYQLTKLQKEVSKQCLKYIKYSDVLLHCVCGAGKTEIMLETIKYYLDNNKKVCFAIPRRQVVLQIYDRLSKLYKGSKVIRVALGFNKDLYGDLTICTTHQLYRYHQRFDLLILDEPDAYPYKGNDILQSIALNSVKGNIIYSTATIDQQLQDKVTNNTIKYLALNKRPHNYPLPIPIVYKGPKLYLHYQLIKFINKYHKRIIIFVPSIKKAKSYHHIYKHLYNTYYLTSKSNNKNQIIDDFINNKYDILFSTTILERGITISNISVIIIYGEHIIYDKASIIQMLGRVGRSFDYPIGNCMILNNRYSINTNSAIKELIKANESM